MAQITNTNSGDKAFVIKGATSQSGDLLDIQPASGTSQFKVDSSGNLLVGMATALAFAAKTLHLANATAPSGTPSGGGVLYVDSGALKYKGSSGTITTLGVA